MSAVKGANLVVRFALELSAVAAVAYWALDTVDGALRWALAIVAPLIVIAVWALFVSPKAAIQVAKPARLAIELAVLGAAAAGLAATGRVTLAVVFAVVAAISGTLNALWS